MAQDVPTYGRRTVAVDRIPEVRFSNGEAQYEAIAQAFSRSAETLKAQQADIEQKAQRRFLLQKKSQASRAMLDLQTKYQSDPAGLSTALDEYKIKYIEDVDDNDLAAELGTAFDLDRDAAVMRATNAQQQRVTQDLQATTLEYMADSSREVQLDSSSLFSTDDTRRDLAFTNLTVKLADIGQNIDRLGPDGQYIFSPEMRANLPRSMMDQALAAGLMGRISESADPNTDLKAMLDGTFKASVPGFADVNPLDLLSPTARDQTIGQLEKVISERAGASKRSWQEFESSMKLQMEIDPTSVNLPDAFAQWQEKAAGVLTPEIASEINVSYAGLLQQQAKASKDYRSALPYINGQQTFDGSEESEKAIKYGYGVMRQSGVPLVDRARYLAGTGITQPPSEFVNELQSGFQRAIVNQDAKMAAEIAEAFDTAQAGAPILGNALDDKIEGGIIYLRDMLRIGGIGPDAFKDVQKIMASDPMLIDERKKEIAALVKETPYRKTAASAIDPSWHDLEPDQKAVVTGQAAADYRKIFEMKYLATGNKDVAMKATEPLIKNLYGKTGLSPEGYMRMPPEKYYSIPGDSDTSWMRDDMFAAVMSKPGLYNPDTNVHQELQAVADPLADPKTSKPEYLLVLSTDPATPFDSLGMVWSPDVKARQTFLTMVSKGTLPDKFKKMHGKFQTQVPDYRAFITDWYKNQSAPTSLEQAPSESIFDGMIKQESGGKQFDKMGRVITSPKGALGIAQVMPDTAPEAAELAGLEFDPVRYRNDADYNKALGRAYFNKQLEDFGNPTLAVMAYNAGPGAVEKYLQKLGDPRKGELTMAEFVKKFPFAETRDYVKKVTQNVMAVKNANQR